MKSQGMLIVKIFLLRPYTLVEVAAALGSAGWAVVLLARNAPVLMSFPQYYSKNHYDYYSHYLASHEIYVNSIEDHQIKV